MDFIEMQKQYMEDGKLINKQIVDTDKEFDFLEGLVENGIKVKPGFKLDKYKFDFKIIGYKILIEIDGKIHEQTREHDYKKDRLAILNGYIVIRFSNNEVNRLNFPEEVKKLIKGINQEYKLTFLEKLLLKIKRR